MNNLAAYWRTHSPLRRLFRHYENKIDSFPAELPGRPPDTLGGFMWYFSRPFAGLIGLCAGLAAATALVEVWVFSFVGQLIDRFADSPRETFFADHSGELLLFCGLVLIVLPLLQLLHHIVLHQGLIGNFAMRTRWQAHRYLLRQSVGFFQDDFAGRLATKVMQTALGVRDSIINFCEVIIYVIVYLFSALVLFALGDWRLALPLFGWLIGYVLLMTYFLPRLRRISMRQAEVRSLVTGRIVDSYTNITTLKMFAHASHEEDYARHGMERFLINVHRQMRLVVRLVVGLSVLNALLLFGVLAMGVYLWQGGAIGAGAIAFSAGLALRIQGMSQFVMWQVAEAFENVGMVQDGIDTLSQDIAVLDLPNAPALKVDRGEVVLDHIGFAYPRKHLPDPKRGAVLNDLSLHVAGGEKIGIVGRSGAGKSTLFQLLLRFYDLQSGRILIDGQNIAEVNRISLAQAIGSVSQDTALLHRSIRDNIRYGSHSASDAQIRKAARLARADEFIDELQDSRGRQGFSAYVGERGVQLSGGQRQRIAIARVLLKDAPILLLDEATSALDSEVEAAIQDSLYNLMRGKTVLAIAHRLSTIAAMDRLVVMDKGRIIEQGDHAELLRRGGLYAELWAHQSGGFIGLDDNPQIYAD